MFCSPDPVSTMFWAAKYGYAGSLDEVLLKGLDSSEHTVWSSGGTPVEYPNSETAKADALLLAVKHQNLDCVKVLLKFNADIEGRFCEATEEMDFDFEDDDLCYSHGCTPLFIAAASGDLEIMRLLLEKGAQVNACDKEHCTPLMIASKNSHVNVVKLLIDREADLALQDQDGETAIHYAVEKDGRDGNSDEILSCLIENGADVNVRSNDNCTPLMVGSRHNCHIDLLKLLVKHGAQIDLQNDDGDTALHYACYPQSSTVFYALRDLGATFLENNYRLTPLLFASNLCEAFFVMDLIQTLDLTKKERVDALELLGASLATQLSPNFQDGFHYMRLGMEERFSDLSNPLFKQPMEPVEAYQKRKESQTPEELAQIENNTDALFMEGLVIRERILGKDNTELIGSITSVAEYYRTHDIINIGMFSSLYKYAIRIAHNSNKSANIPLGSLVSALTERAWHDVPLSANDIVELGNLIVLEYELQEKILRETESVSYEVIDGFRLNMLDFFRSSWRLVQIIAKYKLCDDNEVSPVLKKLLSRDPCWHNRNTLLHEAVVDYGLSGPETVGILLREGMNVNAVNSNGDTPLHRAVTYQPSGDKIHCLMDILQLLFDGGAHHDFVNNYGKTPMDLAETDEARMILSAAERRKLELQCLSAKAVKKFGIPYLGVVPKILEKYINMH